MHLAIDRGIQLLGILAALVIGMATLYGTFDLYSRGPSPPKRLVISRFHSLNPLGDLSAAGSEIAVTVKAGATPIENLRIAQGTIKNAGSAPILPADIIEPIKVTAKSPWRIVTVGTKDSLSDAPTKWSRIDDQTFQAQSTLMNPGDTSWIVIYLSADRSSSITDDSEKDIISWKTRIVNLSNIEIEDDPFEEISQSLGPIQVNIWGNGIFFIIFCFCLYTSLTTLLSLKGGFLKFQLRSISIFVIFLAVNLGAAEASTTYIFGADLFRMTTPNHWFNAPPIIASITIWATLNAKNRGWL